MSWARSVFLALSSRNRFGFVNGSITEPDPFSPLFNSWSCYNTSILSWLTNSLSVELKASVMYINNAKDCGLILRIGSHRVIHHNCLSLRKRSLIFHKVLSQLVLTSSNSKHCGMSLPIISLLLFVLVLVLVDPKLLSWMLSIRNMFFIS